MHGPRGETEAPSSTPVSPEAVARETPGRGSDEGLGQSSPHALTAFFPAHSLQDTGVGFILVIDRRQDKWTSVKASVLRIAVSDPGMSPLCLCPGLNIGLCVLVAVYMGLSTCCMCEVCLCMFKCV